MSARETILRAVRAAQPPTVALPVRRGPRPAGEDLKDRFKTALTAAGANVVHAQRSQLASLLRSMPPGAAATLSTVPGVESTVSSEADRHVLAGLEIFVVQAEMGVAEDGAVWLPLSRIVIRAALFLAEHVIVLLEEGAIVNDLHAAYERLDVRAESFGVFVAGPSKTADIEQCLVIGAHGPKRLTVVLLEDAPHFENESARLT